MGKTGSGISEKPWNGSASRFTDDQYKRAAAACDSPTGDTGNTVKVLCFLPHHEPDGTTNRAGVHAAAQRYSSLKGHQPAAMARAKAHLRSHYSELKEEPPEVIAAAGALATCKTCGGSGKIRAGHVTCPDCNGNGKEASVEPAAKITDATVHAHVTAAHERMSGQHTHDHPTYGEQGGDQHHEHMHSHANDNTHRHDHAMTTQPVGVLSFITAGTYESTDSFDMLGARWGVLQHSDRWAVLTADGTPWMGQPNCAESVTADAATWDPTPGYESYAEAVAAIGEQMAQEDTKSRPVLATAWRADSAFEDVSTGDGRKISKGAIQYRSTPLPLMLQTTTAGGHMGAVLAGTIEQTGMLGQTAVTAGSYDDSEAGRQFEQIVDARGRFGVSIDVAEAEGNFECTERDEDGFCTDGEMVFSLIRIMGQTGTPFPAFENAYIENVTNAAAAMAASGAQGCEGCEEVATGVVEPGSSVSAADDDPLALVAAGGPARPPKHWFEDPGFMPGDGRTVKQPDGQWLCPLTVEPSGRVYGHFAGWNTCHTGYSALCQRPPRSSSNYAAFMLRPIETAEGDIVQVGHISMGCGHIPDDGRVPVDVVRAHYDGGPGARLMARVRCGEDAHGGWFAGAIVEDATESDLRKFRALSVSGHWREVWRGKGLDLLAIVAGVPVPGFPVSAMAAAGYTLSPVEGAIPIGDPQVVYVEGRVTVLVAAGWVRQPMPWERTMMALESRVEEVEQRLRAAERVTAALRSDAAERLVAATIPANGSG